MGRLLLLGLFLTLTACHSGWDKDPFSGEEDRIKNAIEPDKKIEKVPPPEQGTLFVDMQQVYSVVEGDTLEIPVRYKIAHPEVTISSIQVQGLEENFPGSTFDAEKNVIRITPPYDFVPVDTPYIIQPLSVSFFNQYEGQVQEVKRTVVIHVIPQNTSVPVIEDLSFSPANSVVVAGKEKKLLIEVYDTNKEYSPRVTVMNAFGSQLQGAQFVRVPNEGVYNPTNDVWEFEARINIPSDYYLPASKSRVTLEIFSYSITGIPSRSEDISFTIERTPEAPKIVSEKILKFTEKIENQYTFSAFDIRGNGRVTTECVGGPAGMTCDCRRDGFPNNDIAFCTVTWIPETVGEFDLQFKAENKIGSDVVTQVKDVKIEVGSAE